MMIIRSAKPGDISAITRIYKRSVLEETASFELEPPVETEMLKRMNALLADGYPYVVAEKENVILGYAYVGAYRPRPAYKHTVENTVYVSLEAQRQGVGRALLDALIAECVIKGYRQMIAVIGGANHAGSMALHESAGFEKAGLLREVGYKHEQWLDVILMQRSL